MNQKATYELTITGKLEQLPLPDLKDAIWSRIEDQLDIDMPTDDSNGPQTPPSPDWKNLLHRIGPFAVVVALVTIFLINKSKNKVPSVINTKNTPVTQVVTPTKDTVIREQNKSRPVPYPVTTNTNSNPAVKPQGDSALSRNVTADIPNVIDTSTKQDNTQLVQTRTAPPVKDSVQKKPRGVKGITNDDYRIMPVKKDST
jgi:hypothetical protein